MSRIERARAIKKVRLTSIGCLLVCKNKPIKELFSHNLIGNFIARIFGGGTITRQYQSVQSLGEWRGKVLLVCLSTFLLLGVRAQAAILYTVENTSKSLRAVDTTTFTVTPIGPLGVTFNYGDLAWDPGTATLYMVDGREAQSLYRVNITTGAATLIGPHNLTDLFGLAYDTARGRLYGAAFTGPGQLFELNPATGLPTPIGNGIGNRIGALAYNSSADVLLALNDCLGCASLYSVNPSTGAGTLLRSTGLDSNNSGMTYDPILNRYWDLDVNGRLSYFDPANGYLQTEVATLSGSFDGLAFITPVPEPSTFALGVTALLALGFACRRHHYSS